MRLNKLSTLLFVFLIAILGLGQTTSQTATEIQSVTMWNNNAPITETHCLNTVSAQTSNDCVGSMTNVAWFRFTVPIFNGTVLTATSSVRIQVAPNSFDAIVEIFGGTSTAPIYRQCVNNTPSAGIEVLRTNPNAPSNFTISPGIEYYIRVSSLTNIATGCFTIGVQYYPGVHLRVGSFPFPAPENNIPGYSLTNIIRRNISPEGGGPNFDNNVQQTRFRFVNVSDPNSGGCIVTSNTSFVNANQVPCLCYGTSYDVYVQARFEGHWAGETVIRTIIMEYTPNTIITSTSLGTMPTTSCVTVPLSGFVKAGYISSTAVMEWRWCSDGMPCTYVGPLVPGSTTCYLSQVPCLKFGRTYSVSVRVRVCGQWGEWSQPRCIAIPSMPYAQVTNCPTTAVQSWTILWTAFLINIDSYTWLFTPINPNAPVVPIGPAITVTTTNNFVTVGNIPNGTYRVQVKPRSTTCGLIQEGDYYIWCIITKGPGVQGMAVYNTSQATRPIQVLSRSENEIVFDVTNHVESNMGTIKIYDLTGRLVLSEMVFTHDRHGISIPIVGLTGMYIVVYENGTLVESLRIML